MLPTLFTHPARTHARVLVAAAAALCAACLAIPPAAGAITLPPGFEQSTAISELTAPTDVEIAPNGRVFVAEKSGLVKTWDDLSDTTATTFADLRTQVHNFSSRGLLGLAVDPAFPARPYVYVYYTLDAPIGGLPPTFGAPGQTTDQCPGDPDVVNCAVSSRVSRLRADNDRMESEQVLVNDWCQQFPFHAGGGLEFGADGYLYVSGGDGARWGIWDYGQLGSPSNPCGDPPGGVGGLMTPPTAEGGRLRAQDLRTSGDPLGLAGSLARIDPDTGAGVPGNPMFTSAEANAQRMLAHGFRNPARLAIRPGTNDVWVADRGGGYWEELDRVQGGADPVRNFGWPCYEGGLDANGEPYPRIRPRSNDQDLDICENLYAEQNATAAPYWGYEHEQPVVAGEDCETDPVTGEPAGNQISGLGFYPAAGSFPAPYRNALFFADRLRDCIYALLPGSDGVPKRGRAIAFAQRSGAAIDIEVAPNGDLLYVDEAGAVRRVSWKGNSSNTVPVAAMQADTLAGGSPLTVSFTSAGTGDPDSGDLLIYEWDLDGDGAFDDSTEESATRTYLESGTYDVRLRVTDTSGATATDTLTIHVQPPAELTTLTFTPVADARVEEANPATNFGSSSKLQATASVPSRESYLRFQLAGITGRVVSAQLRLTSTTDGTKDGPALFRVGGDWTESAITWSSRPPRDAQPVSDVGPIPLGTVAEWDAKPLVSGDGTLDVGLIPNFNDNVDFGSREHAEPAKRPQLVVSFESQAGDTEAPSAPADLSAQAPSADRVSLGWSAATDNVGVIGYEIYRDGVLLATRGTGTSYTDATVQSRTAYEYAVRALDAAGNRSAPAGPRTVTTPAPPDTQAPSAPAGLSATAAGPRKIDLSWNAASDDTGVTAYEVYRDGQLLAVTGDATSHSDTTVAPQTAYRYTVRALDAAGNRSAAGNEAAVTTPPAPTTTLTYSPVADSYVDERSSATNYGTSSVLQAMAGNNRRRESYMRFQLSGIAGPVLSAKLRLTSTTDGTTDGPALHRVSGAWTENSLTWANRPTRDATPVADVGQVALGAVAEYDVKALVSGNGTVDVGLASTSTDNVDFGSRELADPARRPQLVVTVDAENADTQAPSTPGGLTATAPAPDRVELAWQAATDNVGVTGYEVYRDGALITTLGQVTSYTDVAVSPRTTYDYAVRAIDAAGNRSPVGSTATVTTPAPAAGTTITYGVVADAHVEAAAAGSNFGQAAKLEVVDGARASETYLRFTLAGIAGAVQAAKLRVHVANDGSGNGPAVYGAPSAWTETAITWANRPLRAGGLVTNAGAIAARTWVEYDVLALVSGNGETTFVLAGDSADAANFFSRESSDATKRPQLLVTFSG
jgi:glucose/arabinose dehydrogenase/chitodextrinase